MQNEASETPQTPHAPAATPLEDFFSTQIAIAAIIHDGKESRQTEPLTIDTVPVTIDTANVAAVVDDLREMLLRLMTEHKLPFPVKVRIQNTQLGVTHEISVGAFAGIPRQEVPDAMPYVPPESGEISK